MTNPGDVTIWAIDPARADAAALARLYAIRAACHAERNSREPFMPEPDFDAYLRLPPASEPRRYWRAELAGVTSAFAQLTPTVGSPVAFAVVEVAAATRRQGIGRMLAATVREAAVALGARTLVSSVTDDGGRAFAAALGAGFGRRDVRLLLALATAPVPAAAPAGYRLRSWVGAAPDPLLSSYAATRMAINDAPRAAGDELQPWDARRVRELEQVVAMRGRQTRVTAALLDGEVVGFTELRVSPGSPVATTEDTAVLRGHRGLGIAGSIKAESLRLLRADHPHVRLVATTTAESNVPMLAVNRRLGFVPVQVSTTCTLALD